MWNVYLSLLGYKHVNGPDGATIVPALAEDLPEVSVGRPDVHADARPGLKYSDGTPVKASDFKYAIKRDFLVDSPGVGFFTNIVGADEFSKTKKGEISGITTDDATRQDHDQARQAAGRLPEHPGDDLRGAGAGGNAGEGPVDDPIPSTGPYKIQSYTAEPAVHRWSGTRTSSRPTNVPATNPDKMTFKIVEDDSAALQQVINGQADYDFHPIPVDRLADVQQKYGDQLKIYTPANTYYYFMNTRHAAVRQARRCGRP